MGLSISMAQCIQDMDVLCDKVHAAQAESSRAVSRTVERLRILNDSNTDSLTASEVGVYRSTTLRAMQVASIALGALSVGFGLAPIDKASDFFSTVQRLSFVGDFLKQKDAFSRVSDTFRVGRETLKVGEEMHSSTTTPRLTELRAEHEKLKRMTEQLQQESHKQDAIRSELRRTRQSLGELRAAAIRGR
jgi:hypothetical protein